MYGYRLMHFVGTLVITGFLLTPTCCQISHYENVALNKECSISSKHNETLNKADKAVNGNTGGVYSPGGNCIHTTAALYNWWQVDLGQTYPVYSIVIWAREKRYVERMSRCVIKVDDQVCYTFGYVPTTHARQIRINCTQGILNGTVVRVEKNSTEDHVEKSMNFCEIQIYSCSAGYWGPNCDQPCTGSCRNNDACNPVTGYCNYCQQPGWDPAQGCQEACPNGTYGQECAHSCAENCADTCDPVTGHCTCKPGWKTSTCVEECSNGTFGQDCAQVCSEHCEDMCDKTTGNCTCSPGWAAPRCAEKCEDGTYGLNCSQTCGRCRGGAVCHHIDGNCTECDGAFQPPLCSSCLDGIYGLYCDLQCSENCDGPCDTLTGHCTCKAGWKQPNCTEECDVGFYGPNCLEPCSENCGDDCDKAWGNCTCKPGWMGPTCNQRCQPYTYGVNCSGRCGSCLANAACDRDTGHCHSCKDNFVMPYCTGTDCPSGTYGTNCVQTCGNCTEDTCHPLTGNCACNPGWKPPLCHEACDPGYHGTNCSEKCGRCASSQPCDPHTGHCLACSNNVAMPLCKACLAGYWGANCSQRCGHCGGDGACERGTGNCLHFCRPGWTGSRRCDKQCDDGWYGNNCSLQCGSCRDGAPCRHDNGFCEECEEGYDGYLCQRASGSAVYGPAQVGAIAGSVVTVGLVVALAVLAGAWWIRRKRDKQQGNRSDNIGPNARLTRHDNESARNARREDIKFDDLGKRTENSKGQKPIREMEYLY